MATTLPIDITFEETPPSILVPSLRDQFPNLTINLVEINAWPALVISGPEDTIRDLLGDDGFAFDPDMINDTIITD